MKSFSLTIFFNLCLILFLSSCSLKTNEESMGNSDKVKNIYNYIVSDTLEINEFGFWYAGGQMHSGNLFVTNKDKQRIEMYSQKGKLISYFGQKGQGPREFLNITMFDIYDNDLFIIDKQKFTITHLKIDKTKLEYISEFKLTKQPLQLCVIKENLLLTTFPGDLKNLKLFSETGKLLREYSIPQKIKFKNSKDYMASSFWIDNYNEKYFILGNTAKLKLYFCEFDAKNYDVTLLKKRRMLYQRKNKKKFIFKNSNTLEIMGLSQISHSSECYFVSLRSDIKELSQTFFEMYDKYGNYIGNSEIIGYKAVYKTFSDNGEKIWFKTLDDNELLYVARRE